MTVDPREYDLAELRAMAGVDTPRSDADIDAPRIELPASESVHRGRLRRELLVLGEATDGLQKPYLGSLPANRNAEAIVFEWLDFLLTVGGFGGATDALRYYQMLGWVSEDARATLETYLDGFPDPRTSGDGRLTVEDHRESLAFVAQLRALS